MGVIIAIPLTIRFFLSFYVSQYKGRFIFDVGQKRFSRTEKCPEKKSPVFSCNGLFQIDYFDKNGFDDVGANECQ